MFLMGKNINQRVAEIKRLCEQGKFRPALEKINDYLSRVNYDEKDGLYNLRVEIYNELFKSGYQGIVNQIKAAINKNQESLALKQLEQLKGFVCEEKKESGDVTPDNFNEAEQWIFYFDYYFEAIILLADNKYDEASRKCSEAIELCPDSEEAKTLNQVIIEKQEAEQREKDFSGIQPLFVFDSINVPKKENEGEDADPFVKSDNNTSWGAIAVFDGMGGAGARKYRHKESNEEHTAAYWASRIVRDAIKHIFDTRKVGENPITRVNENIYNYIKCQLNQSILDFPNANSNVLSKMSHKLPTTLAMAAFEIKEGNVSINSYWAGDSRIIVLNEDKIIYLTLDDADAPDGDPISPQNMDLPMNNAIYQDSDFKINYSQLDIPVSENKPFLLIASTDGCFGYFHNPIEFEVMMRKSILAANSENEIMDYIKQAIIENIQQDDFSMAMIAFGYSNFNIFKDVLTKKLANESLATSYYTWRDEIKGKRHQIEGQLEDFTQKLQSLKQELEHLHEEDAQENINWYNRYKETITIVKREDIKTIK